MKETKKIINRKEIIKYLKKIVIIGILAIAVVIQGSNVFAADDPLEVINNLSTFIFSIIRAIGMILLGWGIVQIGLALKSHDPSQRANGFMTLAGGVIITFAKEILNLITGG
jgi:hypothetical protein